jgi:DNA-binding MarR family transcriptional regulator
VTLNINGDASEHEPRSRQDLVESLLDEMTPWNPNERMSAFRSWLSGSLSLVHLHVLTILELDGPLSMSRLAEALDVSVASATGIVSRMEERRLVERRHDEADRRVVFVHPTRLGAEVFARLRRQRRDKLSKLLARLTDDELTAFLVGLRAMRRARAAMGPEATMGPEGETEPTTKSSDPDATPEPGS